MEEEQIVEEVIKSEIPPFRWFIACLADGQYYFITPEGHESACQYIGEHGGALYTHAGYLVMAASQGWWNFFNRKYEQANKNVPLHLRPPHIDVPNIECKFSKSAIQWLQDNEEMLKEIGGKYYDNLPRYTA